MDTQQHIVVIGAGSWGTALAILLANNQHNVSLWGNEPDYLLAMQQQRSNPHYLPNVRLPDNLHISLDLIPALKKAHAVLIVVPSHAFRTVLQQIKPHLNPQQSLIWATKGLERNLNGQHLFLHQVAETELGQSQPLAVSSGPTFAKEVAQSLPTAMTVATADIAHAEQVARLFHNHYFRTYTSDDMIGVQLGGAAKNVIAIAAGVADGLNLGANTRAAIITRGLYEIMRLGIALGGRAETFMGLAGLGDLVLTCTDNQSRNRRFGLALGRGQNIEQAQRDIGQVVEGVHAVAQIHQLARQQKIEMPLTEQVNLVLQGCCTVQQAAQYLLSREPKQENHD